MTTTVWGMARRLATVLILALLGLAFIPGAGSAAVPAAPPVDGQATGPAFVRLAHLSPDTPNVDVYLASVSRPDERFVVPGVAYGTVSDYRALPPGAYTVSMRSAGAPADAPPVLTTTVDTASGAAYTVAGVGYYRQLGLTVLDDDLAMPEPGQARVRVINAAATAPRVDVAADGAGELATGVPFAAGTGYRSVPAGSWTLQVRPQGGEPARLPIEVSANSVYTVLLLDGGQGLRTELHTDSTGSASVPHGAVETGLGGTAGPGWWEPALLLLAAGAASVLTGVVYRRRSG